MVFGLALSLDEKIRGCTAVVLEKRGQAAPSSSLSRTSSTFEKFSFMIVQRKIYSPSWQPSESELVAC
jgi:hypothetical protein